MSVVDTETEFAYEEDTYLGIVFLIFGALLLSTGLVGWWSLESGLADRIMELPGHYMLVLVIGYFVLGCLAMWKPHILVAEAFAIYVGVLFSPTFNHYLDVLDGETIIFGVGFTGLVFLAAALTPVLTGISVDERGIPFLTILWGLLGIVLARAFFELPSALDLTVSLGIIVFFSIFTAWEIERAQKTQDPPSRVAVSIYLNFLIILFEVLRVLSET